MNINERSPVRCFELLAARTTAKSATHYRIVAETKRDASPAGQEASEEGEATCHLVL